MTIYGSITFVFWLGIAGYLAHNLEKRARAYGACHLSVTLIWMEKIG